MNLELKIILKKKSPQTIFEIHRNDGSFTFARIQQGMEFHELGHWVVESSLNLKHAFYGMIGQGHNIEDFEKPRDQRSIELMPKNLPVESIFVEHYVNLLMTEVNSGVQENFLTQLSEICNSKDIPIPTSLNKEKIDVIRSLYKTQMNKWNALPPGGILILRI